MERIQRIGAGAYGFYGELRKRITPITSEVWKEVKTAAWAGGRVTALARKVSKIYKGVNMAKVFSFASKVKSAFKIVGKFGKAGYFLSVLKVPDYIEGGWVATKDMYDVFKENVVYRVPPLFQKVKSIVKKKPAAVEEAELKEYDLKGRIKSAVEVKSAGKGGDAFMRLVDNVGGSIKTAGLFILGLDSVGVVVGATALSVGWALTGVGVIASGAMLVYTGVKGIMGLRLRSKLTVALAEIEFSVNADDQLESVEAGLESVSTLINEEGDVTRTASRLYMTLCGLGKKYQASLEGDLKEIDKAEKALKSAKRSEDPAEIQKAEEKLRELRKAGVLGKIREGNKALRAAEKSGDQVKIKEAKKQLREAQMEGAMLIQNMKVRLDRHLTYIAIAAVATAIATALLGISVVVGLTGVGLPAGVLIGLGTFAIIGIAFSIAAYAYKVHYLRDPDDPCYVTSIYDMNDHKAWCIQVARNAYNDSNMSELEALEKLRVYEQTLRDRKAAEKAAKKQEVNKTVQAIVTVISFPYRELWKFDWVHKMHKQEEKEEFFGTVPIPL